MFAQTKVSVTVQSNTFTPSSININIGDTVEWTNIGGSHNVNGTQGTFPSNPLSFGNAVAGPGWTYSFVFTSAGAYNYRCDPHFSFGMTGTITVQGSTGINEAINLSEVSFYPNPATKELFFTANKEVENIIVYSLTGEQVLASSLSGNKLDVSTLTTGIYFVKVVTKNNEITKKLIIQ